MNVSLLTQWNAVKLRRDTYRIQQDGFVYHHNVRLSTVPRPLSRPLPVVSTPVDIVPFRTHATLYASVTKHPRGFNNEDLSLLYALNRNARTRGQFKPKNSSKGTSSYQLRQFAEATLGSGSLRKAVRLPEGEDLSEWLAVNGRKNTAIAWWSG